MSALAYEAPRRLTILYDERCTLCRRASAWLRTQPCLVEVELLPAGSAEARKRYGEITALGNELVVVDEKGNAWIGPSAFLACMWATARYRAWAFRLSRPSLAPYAERVFRKVSRSRAMWGYDDPEDCTWCGTGKPAGVAAKPIGTLVTCKQGHPMPATANFCRHCGSVRGAVRVGSGANDAGA